MLRGFGFYDTAMVDIVHDVVYIRGNWDIR